MQDWMLPHITSYWDERVEAIERFSRLIAATPESERVSELSALSAAVKRHSETLDDADIVKFAVPIVDDLYKAAAYRTYIDEPLLQYLKASCSPLFETLRARGYFVEYFVDNTWGRLVGPVTAFPMWFSETGLFYICPQEIACNAFEKDKPEAEWPALVQKYSADARRVAAELVARCRQARRHFVYLDIDADVDDLKLVHDINEDGGGIVVFRQETPEPGSHIAVRLPKIPCEAQTPPEREPVSSSSGTPTIDSLS